MLEADDRLTLDAISAEGLPPHFSVMILPPAPHKTKPRALNAALMFAKGSLITIFDAEDEPEPDQLRKAAAQFAGCDDRLACLQASLVPDNMRDGLLQSLFALEYGMHFDVVMQGLANLGLPLPLGGTSNHFRKDCLLRIGAWDASNVTEDADLGLRLARSGYRTKMLDSTTFEEAPPTLKAWFNQRRRWSKGWLQTAIAHCHRPSESIAELGGLRRAAAFYLTACAILALLAYPFALSTLLSLCRGPARLFSGEPMHDFAFLSISWWLCSEPSSSFCRL